MIQRLPDVVLDQIEADEAQESVPDERFITPEVRILDPVQARLFILDRMRRGIDR